MDFFSMTSFEEDLPYKDGRKCRWIKFDVNYVGGYEASRLSELTRLQVPHLRALAVRFSNKLPNDPQWLAQQIGSPSYPVNLDELREHGFIYDWKPQSTEAHGNSRNPTKSTEIHGRPRKTTRSTRGEESRGEG